MAKWCENTYLYQIAVHGEAKAAHLTDVGPLTGVHPNVHFEFIVGDKGTLAVGVGAAMWAEVAVPSGNVLFQAVLVLHCRTTVRTFALAVLVGSSHVLGKGFGIA